MARKQHLHHFIYRTTCIITNRFYIGMHSTSDINDGYIGSGKRLWNSINKHGRDNHHIEILEFLSDRDSLKTREKELVNKDLLKDPLCMNLVIGGEGGYGFFNDKHKSILINAGNEKLNELRSDPNWMKAYSEKMSVSQKASHAMGRNKDYRPRFTGKTHKAESKKAIGDKNSVHQQGEGNSQFGTCWIFNELESKKINKDDLTSYIKLGWKKGRKIYKDSNSNFKNLQPFNL